MDEPDFIVSELLSELKEENKRKDAYIKVLQKSIARIAIAALVAVLLVIGACLLYLNQYDFSSTETSTIEKNAEGIYAIIDSDDNVVGYDLTPEQFERIMNNGESDIENDTD